MQPPLRKLLTTTLGLVATALALVSCGGEPASAPARAATKRPNVLLIVVDTARGDRCSVNGYERPTTPSLEALAKEGTRFRNCWSPSPWTAPAHASLFTGFLPAHHGLQGGRARFHLTPEYWTLAEILRDAGYATACYTANDYIKPEFGLTQGFEHYWGIWEGHDDVHPPADYAHRKAYDWAMDQHRQGKPFFVFVNDIEPHAPYEPLSPHRERFVDADVTPEEIADAADFFAARSLDFTLGVREETPRYLGLLSDLYDAEIAMVDATLAPLFEALREQGVLDETLVIVTSDHGENLGERHMGEHIFSCNRSLLHVPLVIRFPGAFEAGATIDDVVRLEDLFPTILELCHLPVPRGIDAKSLLDDRSGRIARGEYAGSIKALESASRRHPGLDLRSFDVSMRSVFDGRFHYIERSDGGVEFYDVAADPLELVNAAAAHAADVERLRALLAD